ncbi:FHA domain-containing protein [Rhizohabitans arisaemae]|uniref:FHA domain-containing protein n=1 Tax=Rhizohabitans arisaemae TaxID=2720610 RepID=UPI0024B1A7BC|nr:FHA domain-containing protein [Rhizohabitans arisaemae]
MEGPVVRPMSGGGLVVHSGGLLLVCGSADGGSEGLSGGTVDGLLAAIREVAAVGGDGRTLARRVAQVLAASMAHEVLACAIAGPVAGGFAVLVSGAATARLVGQAGEVHLDGREALTWVDRLVPGPVTHIELSLPGAGEPHPHWYLDSGVVGGGGITWSPSGAMGHADRHPSPAEQAPVLRSPPVAQQGPEYGHRHPVTQRRVAEPSPVVAQPAVPVTPFPLVPPHQQATPPPQAAAPPVAEQPRPVEPPTPPQPPTPDPEQKPFEAVLLIPEAADEVVAPPVVEPDSRPTVYGVDCKNDHFNDPRVPYCVACGIALVQRTLVPRRGPRPPLGVLLLDDGMTLRLDTDYLVGRDPERAQEVASGEARPIRLADMDGSVSRRHLRVTLENWDVKLVDLNSVNGTRVQGPSDPDFRDIPANQPVTIVPGTKILVGGSRVIRYESHRNQ